MASRQGQAWPYRKNWLSFSKNYSQNFFEMRFQLALIPLSHHHYSNFPYHLICHLRRLSALSTNFLSVTLKQILLEKLVHYYLKELPFQFLLGEPQRQPLGVY
jgi:hypothetical protein